MADTQGRRLVMMGLAAGAAVLMGVLVPAFAASTKGRVGGASSAGHAAPAPKNEDVLPALLAEVRGLRAAMELMASAGPRVQLFASRLQLQETRMNNMIRRLDGVRESLASEQREMPKLQDELKRMDTALSSGVDSQQRREADAIAPHLRRVASERRTTISRLIAEEAQMTQDLATEQARWTEINQRLDELERALARR